MIQIQVTLFDKGGHYKPVSALVNVESKEYAIQHKDEIRISGVTKICQKRYWDAKDLMKYGYTLCKMRVYNPTKGKEEKK